jgi:hypothetical protein
MKFFVWLNDKQEGPFDEEAIRQMLSQGQIAQDTLACPEGSEDWVSVKDLFFKDSLPESFADISSIDETVSTSTNDGSYVQIRLNSGTELKIKAICLYDENLLAALNSKKAQAAKMLQGVSTGLGAIGSIEWVLGASIVIGAAEAVLSAGASSTGIKLLEEAIQADRKLRNEGVFLIVSKIHSIEHPVPRLWRLRGKKMAQVEIVTSLASSKMETRAVFTTYIHNGDEFLSVVTDDDSVQSIRWSAVEHYFYKSAK